MVSGVEKRGGRVISFVEGTRLAKGALRVGVRTHVHVPFAHAFRIHSHRRVPVHRVLGSSPVQHQPSVRRGHSRRLVAERHDGPPPDVAALLNIVKRPAAVEPQTHPNAL